ncbi:MAG: SDR family NAD(P)-dependent oxidoreductase [Rhodobacteraceae bacterium]|nr:SDR family NAD(P)-dependent oxidoreductase [Paracoccaceae bacterium]
MSPVLLSIGHGYSGRATEAALPGGWRVLGTSRQPGAAVPWPDGAAQAMAEATHLLSWVPPGPDGDPVLPVIHDLPAPRLRWIGYASASSVYGDTGGAWIDETAPDAPTTARGHARLAAEQAWCAFARARALPLARLRIAGIYGPGRSPLEALTAGRAQRVVRPGQVFNRIHVEDLGRIAAAAAQARFDGPLILADREPAPLAEVTTYAADLLGLTPPPEIAYEDAQLSPTAKSFWAENKRLASRHLATLGVSLRYPTYREGLTALAAHHRDPSA